MTGSGETAGHIPTLGFWEFYVYSVRGEFYNWSLTLTSRVAETEQTSGGELVYCNFRNGLYGATEEAGNFIY